MMLASLWSARACASLKRRRGLSSSRAIFLPTRGKATAAEDIYERKTPIEHVLLRPGMYVGSVEATTTNTWIWSRSTRQGADASASDSNSADDLRQYMRREDIEYTPALIKLFDEILVNAADNIHRDKAQTYIKVEIGKEEGEKGRHYISVRNDGRGIPVKIHPTEGMYIPELVFGHLLTGSNFNDSEGRLTGGRHGYGAKLTNIFSSEFTVEILDSKRGLLLQQTWSNNMTEVRPPVVTALDTPAASPPLKDYTKITFMPDLKRLLGNEDAGFGSGNILMLEKRVLDVAACIAPVKVFLNDQAVPIHSFREYMDMHVTSESLEGRTEPHHELLCSRVNKRWLVGVELAEIGQFEQVSGLCTTD
ncbi:unnamed protein product [Chrysoparadoxa australica]